MKKIMLVFISVMSMLALSGCFGCKGDDCPVVPPTHSYNSAPVISGVEDVTIDIALGTWGLEEYITATDAEDGDLTSSIVVTGTVDLLVVGVYVLTYYVEDSDLLSDTITQTVTVIDTTVIYVPELTYPSGFYNYKFVNYELRYTFMAAAEKWLLDSQVGGIPMFTSNSHILYSQRIELPVDYYIPVMEFGEEMGSMIADDSTVTMYDGLPGNVDEYTFRTANYVNPNTFNQWIYDTSSDSDLMGLYYGSLYGYEFNTNKNGYALNPSMASGDPVYINGTQLDTGKWVSTRWTVPVRVDLEWYFHPDVESVYGFNPSDYESAIEPQDFIDTFKLAIDEEWFRAVSGGGDFFSSAHAIEGLQEYVDGTGSWNDVGLKVNNNNELEFEFISYMSEWNVKYFLSSFVTTPINMDLYDHLQNDLDGMGNNVYGTDIYSIGYTGVYYIDEYIEDTVVRMKKNPNYFDKDNYFYTGYDFIIESNADVILQTYLDGELDVTKINASMVSSGLYSRAKIIPGSTTYRIMINSSKTVENQLDYNPDSTYIPEPLLGHDDFKQAMYFAIDREYLAEDVLSDNRTASMYYFTETLLIDAENGTPFRNTEQGMSVGAGLSPDTFGYNFDAAQELFKNAVDDLIEEGYYTEGTANDYTVITIALNNYTDSVSWDLTAEYIEEVFEETFIYEEKFVKVNIDIIERSFPAIYYDYMMPGNFDLSFGGISTCTLCGGGSILAEYLSDNRSGFFVNPGVDTSKAEIEVIYYDVDGYKRIEMWSLDAIASALEGEVFLINGEETTFPTAKDIEVTPTTIEFTIAEYNNIAYENITYTVQWYSLYDDKYYDLDGYIGLVPTSEKVEIEGLTPFYYGLDEFGDTIYQGDYIIVVDFGFTIDDEKFEQTESKWFEMGELLSGTEIIINEDNAVINTIVNYYDNGREVESIELYDNGVLVDGITSVVTFLPSSGITNIVLSDFDVTKEYIVKITFDDGLVAYIEYEIES